MKKAALLTTTLALTACGGGSFGVSPVITIGSNPGTTDNGQTTPEPEPHTPITREEAEGMMKPALGYAMQIPRRNAAPGKEPRLDLDLSKIERITDNDINRIPHQDELEERFGESHVFTPKAQQGKYEYINVGWIYSGLDDNYHDYKVENGEWLEDYTQGDGYLFYKGSLPAQALPKGTSIKYAGHWDFVTNAAAKRELPESLVVVDIGGGEHFGHDKGFGENVGATSFSERNIFNQYRPREGNHLSEFTVNFDEKQLDGTLKRRYKPTRDAAETLEDRYKINAKLQGNRFVGSATTTNANKSANLLYAHAAERVEGGFFGPKAEELAGKFITDDQSAFVVFGAKQTGEAAEADETLLDAIHIDTSAVSDKPDTQYVKSTLPNLGRADRLILDGHEFDLVPEDNPFVSKQEVTLANGEVLTITACCGNLDYVKFGSAEKTKPAKPTEPEDEDHDDDIHDDDDEHYDDHDDEHFDDDASEDADNDDEDHDDDIHDDDDEHYDDHDDEHFDDDASEDADNDGANDDNLTNQSNDSSDDTTAVDSADTAGTHGAPSDTHQDDDHDDIDDSTLLPHTEAPKVLTHNHSTRALFLQGERTPLSEMPTSGSAYYVGTWEAHIGPYWRSPAGTGQDSSLATFDVNFDDKTVKGELTEHKGVKPAFYIDAKINKNAFHGTATTRAEGINLDPKRVLQPLIVHMEAEVDGAFYGPQARELGGSFYSKEHEAGAVFGATKQEKNSNK